MRPWLHAQHLDRQHQHLRPPVPAPKRHLPQRPGRPLLRGAAVHQRPVRRQVPVNTYLVTGGRGTHQLVKKPAVLQPVADNTGSCVCHKVRPGPVGDVQEELLPRL